MAVITDLDLQLLLIQRVGDVDPDSGDPVSPLRPNANGIVLQNSERLWNQYVAYRGLHPTLGTRLFDAYFMRAATELIIGVLESRVDFSAVGTAMRVSLNQRRARAERFLDTLTDRIDHIECQLQAWALPAHGALTTITPTIPPLPATSSNPFFWSPWGDDPRYAGSVYWTSWRRNNVWP